MSEPTLYNALKDIADAIRAKGITGTMSALEMPTKIASIAGSKYGITLDGLIGDVNGQGVLQWPEETFTFSSEEIVEIPDDMLTSRFANSKGLTAVYLPNLTTLGEYALARAFNVCENLTSADLGSLTATASHGLENAFSECDSLTDIDLHSLTTIDEYGLKSAFTDDTSLKHIDLSSVTSIGNYGMESALAGCTSLKTVDLTGVTSLGSYALHNAFINSNSNTAVVRFGDLTSVADMALETSFSYSTAQDFTSATQVARYAPNGAKVLNREQKVVVPDSLYDAWTGDKTNDWSQVWLNSKVVKESDCWLKFTAQQANSTVALTVDGTPPTPVKLKVSTNNGQTWSDYTIGSTITLANIDDTVAFKAHEDGNHTLSDGATYYHKFAMTGTIKASGNALALLNEMAVSDTGTDLPSNALYRLFKNCTSLTEAPDIGCENVYMGCGDYCFNEMYSGCTNLTKGGHIYALSSSKTAPYALMYKDCSSLNEIWLHNETTMSDSTVFANWVSGVSATGTFHGGIVSPVYGANSIPTGWDIDWVGCVRVTALANNTTVQFTPQAYDNSIEWNDGTSTTWSTTNKTKTLSQGQVMCFRAHKNPPVALSGGTVGTSYNIKITGGNAKVDGYLGSLIYKDCPNIKSTKLYPYGDYTFFYMFENSTALTDISGLVWDKNLKIGGSSGFRRLFQNTAIPSIVWRGPKTIENSELMETFKNCSSLTSVDFSKVETIGQDGMRGGLNPCTSLTSVDFSNLTTIDSGGLLWGLNQCTALQTIEFPKLTTAITGSTGGALSNTFRGCTGLKTVRMPKLSNVTDSDTMTNMFLNCSALETVDFSEATTVIPFGTNMFNGASNAYKVYVPDALLTQWKAATGWSDISSHIYPASEMPA